jgi:pyruvate dehydrogenase E2 component (dihydrolipoamide acetyltransferase)
MVAAAVRMRTPAMMARGAASMRRPQVSYKFQEVIQYAL